MRKDVLGAAAACLSSCLGAWLERLARVQRRRAEAHLLSQLDTRVLRDAGLLGRVPRDRHRLARPFWWLPSDPDERRRG
jgi:hypothetical protein